MAAARLGKSLKDLCFSSGANNLHIKKKFISRNYFCLGSLSLFHEEGNRKLVNQPRRHLSVHEYIAIDMLRNEGITVPNGGVARTPDEALSIAESLESEDYVIKAQVLAGGRGKGHFDGGLKGGVKIVFSP